MRSVAHIKGHPIHPMLIPFPIAFLTGAFVADLVGLIRDSSDFWTFGGWLALAGILTALLAAVPGLIDLIYTVPPDSSAKKRGLYHMSVNLVVVGMFFVAWLIRDSDPPQPSLLVVVLEALGAGLLGVGGWLGGTLAYRNMIGVDHRYAEAGKWQEQWVEPARNQVIDAGECDDLEVDQMKLIRAGDQRIVIGRTGDGHVAFEDHCTHRGGSLAGGVMIAGTVQCLWHGSQFDCRTGAVKAGPAEDPIKTYPIEVRDGRVFVRTGDQESGGGDDAT